MIAIETVQAFRRLAFAIVAVCCLTCGFALSQTISPATAPASVLWLVTVTEVQGLVQVRQPFDLLWSALAVGAVLPENSELRIGPRSAARFILPSGKTATLNRLGTIKVKPSSFEVVEVPLTLKLQSPTTFPAAPSSTLRIYTGRTLKDQLRPSPPLSSKAPATAPD